MNRNTIPQPQPAPIFLVDSELREGAVKTDRALDPSPGAQRASWLRDTGETLLARVQVGLDRMRADIRSLLVQHPWMTVLGGAWIGRRLTRKSRK